MLLRLRKGCLYTFRLQKKRINRPCRFVSGTENFTCTVSKVSAVMVKLRARCLLLGDAAVGKTALSHVFFNEGGLFMKNYNMTSGVQLLMKCVNVPETSDSVEFHMIDCPGKDAFLEASEKMWGEPSLLCLVFDLTSEQSFTNCRRWLERVRPLCEGRCVPGVLVGNKLDLYGRREVQKSVAKEWALCNELQYFESSTKEIQNWDAPLVSLAQAFHSLYQESRDRIQNLSRS